MNRIAIVSFAASLAVLWSACSSDDAEPTVVELSAGEGDGLMSCLAFDPEILAEMPLAFEGTVEEVDGARVTLDVDRWFTGGDADRVVLEAPLGMEALIGGISFAEGGSYLISATDGVVNYCGFSGESTPELVAGFEAAFGD